MWFGRRLCSAVQGLRPQATPTSSMAYYINFVEGREFLIVCALLWSHPQLCVPPLTSILHVVWPVSACGWLELIISLLYSAKLKELRCYSNVSCSGEWSRTDWPGSRGYSLVTTGFVTTGLLLAAMVGTWLNCTTNWLGLVLVTELGWRCFLSIILHWYMDK